jgi:hypothetical protein
MLIEAQGGKTGLGTSRCPGPSQQLQPQPQACPSPLFSTNKNTSAADLTKYGGEGRMTKCKQAVAEMEVAERLVPCTYAPIRN